MLMLNMLKKSKHTLKKSNHMLNYSKHIDKQVYSEKYTCNHMDKQVYSEKYTCNLMPTTNRWDLVSPKENNKRQGWVRDDDMSGNDDNSSQQRTSAAWLYVPATVMCYGSSAAASRLLVTPRRCPCYCLRMPSY
jgi:hypothetical protein